MPNAEADLMSSGGSAQPRSKSVPPTPTPTPTANKRAFNNSTESTINSAVASDSANSTLIRPKRINQNTDRYGFTMELTRTTVPQKRPLPAQQGYTSMKRSEIAIKLKKPRPPNLKYVTRFTGVCYDVRMRFHATVDVEDVHPEDPRRIFSIYEELMKNGLIAREQTVWNPNTDPDCMRPVAPMVVFTSREVTKEEALLVHTEDHWNFIEETASKLTLITNKCAMMGRR